MPVDTGAGLQRVGRTTTGGLFKAAAIPIAKPPAKVQTPPKSAKKDKKASNLEIMRQMRAEDSSKSNKEESAWLAAIASSAAVDALDAGAASPPSARPANDEAEDSNGKQQQPSPGAESSPGGGELSSPGVKSSPGGETAEDSAVFDSIPLSSVPFSLLSPDRSVEATTTEAAAVTAAAVTAAAITEAAERRAEADGPQPLLPEPAPALPEPKAPSEPSWPEPKSAAELAAAPAPPLPKLTPRQTKPLPQSTPRQRKPLQQSTPRQAKKQAKKKHAAAAKVQKFWKQKASPTTSPLNAIPEDRSARTSPEASSQKTSPNAAPIKPRPAALGSAASSPQPAGASPAPLQPGAGKGRPAMLSDEETALLTPPPAELLLAASPMPPSRLGASMQSEHRVSPDQTISTSAAEAGRLASPALEGARRVADAVAALNSPLPKYGQPAQAQHPLGPPQPLPTHSFAAKRPEERPWFLRCFPEPQPESAGPVELGGVGGGVGRAPVGPLQVGLASDVQLLFSTVKGMAEMQELLLDRLDMMTTRLNGLDEQVASLHRGAPHAARGAVADRLMRSAGLFSKRSNRGGASYAEEHGLTGGGNALLMSEVGRLRRDNLESQNVKSSLEVGLRC